MFLDDAMYDFYLDHARRDEPEPRCVVTFAHMHNFDLSEFEDRV